MTSRRALPSPDRARSGSRSSALTGRGESGRAVAALRARIAAFAEVAASARAGTVGPTMTSEGPKQSERSSTASSSSESPPRAMSSRLSWMPGGASAALADRALRLSPVRGGAPGELGDGVPAHERVDDHGFEPGIPGAASRGRAGIDIGGGEGDRSGVDEHGFSQGQLLGRTRDVGHAFLDDFDDDLEQLQGLLQADRADEVPRC